MAKFPPILRAWKRGDDLTADHLQEAVEALTLLLSEAQPPLQVLPAWKFFVRQFKIASIDNDHLLCNTWNGTTQGDEDYAVAKPYLLRKTPFDGETRSGITYAYSAAQTRTADNGSNADTETVQPSYVAGDILYAIPFVLGGTDTEYDDGQFGTVAVSWLDLNTDGRQWVLSGSTSSRATLIDDGCKSETRRFRDGILVAVT